MTPSNKQHADGLGRGWRRFLLAVAFTPSAVAFALSDYLLTRSWLWAIPLTAILAASFVLARRIDRFDSS